MSGLSMRTRLTTVAISAAIVAPFALMGGSAEAVEAPIVGNEVPAGDLLGGLLSTATGTAGTSGLPVSSATGLASNPLAATDVVTGTLGSVLGTGALSGVTSLADLEGVLETVTGLLDIDGILETVKGVVGTVLSTLNLDKLLNVPVKVNTSKGEVAGASKTSTKAKKATETVDAGALPHTGGNADLTAMLLCAGLAVAGTGVTLVTRRRGSILGAA